VIEDVPRRNGELAFDEAWQPRAFGLAVGVVDHSLGGDWEPFRQRLITAIADVPDRDYWDSWLAALEDLVVSHALLTHDVLATLPPAERHPHPIG
jgi:hypothetical protein